MNATADYGLHVRLKAPYEEALERVTEALADEGFGVLTKIDVKDTLKQKLDVDFRPYMILGACNPALAYQAFQADTHVGLLLPCNVIVYDDGDESEVAILDPGVMLKVADNPGLQPIADEARARLQRVRDGLAA